MKVIIVNKFFYRRGGADICAINQVKLLQAYGHEVAVYSMDYSDNVKVDAMSVMAPEVTFKGSIKNKIRFFMRTMGWDSMTVQFGKFIDDFRPDVVHLNNIHSYLSPILAKVAHEHGVKVVWTLHDYKLLCPSYACLREGKVCEQCFFDKHHVITTRCMKRSLPASILAYLEANKWNRQKIGKWAHRFICPSEFIGRKMIQGGFDPTRMVVLNNFVAPEIEQRCKSTEANSVRDEYYCYIGRLSSEKGVETLLRAASILPYRLKIVGDGPLFVELNEKYSSEGRIEFLGKKGADEVASILSNSRFSVVPSECYENNPLSVIESLCTGTPVVGSNMGGIPELIGSQSGIIFPMGNVEALTTAITEAWDRDWDYIEIQRNAIHRFSSETHYNELMKIYQA